MKTFKFKLYPSVTFSPFSMDLQAQLFVSLEPALPPPISVDSMA